GLGDVRPPGATELLMDLVADPWSSMRAAALSSLAKIDPAGFVTILSSLEPDSHWWVRAAVARALGGVDPAVAVPRLTGMLADTDRRVVPAVLAALARLKPPDLEARLREHLRDPDPVVRATAARELGALKPADGVDVFASAYRAWAADDTYVARAAALAAAAAYGAPAVPLLREALADREWAVRVRALELLRGLDPEAAAAADLGPATAGDPALYEAPELLTPKFSPHLYVETSRGLVEIELAVTDAPLATHRIMTLARKGFFAKLFFHRVEPGYVVQTGDPRGDGEGGPGFTIRDELSPRPYLRGTVGLALDWRDTAGSQFFVTYAPQPHLDGRYTIIGRVVAGMEVIDRLQQWDTIERVRVWDGTTLTGAASRGAGDGQAKRRPRR
ncbi:MAG TPA: peptidylprolyl isomerase, partial [Vicinamibacterales bacterium]|nr:peptidylprolyl isomerase [Vicinamibacterales bacterium]